MPIVRHPDGFDLVLGGRLILRHRPEAPCLFVGRGDPRIDMYRGNFDIADRLEERLPLRHAHIEADRIAFAPGPDTPPRLTMTVVDGGDDMQLLFDPADDGSNRVWLRVAAEPDEHVWGGGEQMSYLNLRGRRYPLWTSEPGVGRDKTTPITFQADVMGRAGGDYWTTNYPQPTYLSSRHYALHVETAAYAVFDFERPEQHEIEIWAVPDRIELWARPGIAALVGVMANRFGRQPPFPEWLYAGAIIGLKDGERSFARLDSIRAAGAAVSALWCEDWAGLRQTSFGTRLFWDWQANPARYPDLATRIAALRAQGIRFLGYVNPYLCADGALFQEADRHGFFARSAAGQTALVDFGEFECGVVDFTNPAASDWFAERILGTNMLDAGLSGWMADFGEYLPTDIRLSDGSDPLLVHNRWPTIWAEVNSRAIARRGRTGDSLFFMRAGYTGVQAHCPLLWGGDQSVDFSRHDGLVSAICGALSAGLLGNAFHHSDIGGYTSLFGNVRTPELLMRWAEMAAFTPVMRTHEANRPGENLQVDGDPAVLAHFARATRLWLHLVPYLRTLVAEAAASGLPAQRALFLHYEADRRTHTIQDAYLYGSDLLVAPVHRAGCAQWETYLPAGDQWIHVWTGVAFVGGDTVTVAAPLGHPPVFFRSSTSHRTLFEGLQSL